MTLGRRRVVVVSDVWSVQWLTVTPAPWPLSDHIDRHRRPLVLYKSINLVSSCSRSARSKATQWASRSMRVMLCHLRWRRRKPTFTLAANNFRFSIIAHGEPKEVRYESKFTALSLPTHCETTRKMSLHPLRKEVVIFPRFLCQQDYSKVMEEINDDDGDDDIVMNLNFLSQIFFGMLGLGTRNNRLDYHEKAEIFSFFLLR